MLPPRFVQSTSVLAYLTIALATACNAALVERDLLNPGDGLITFDSSSGLEWLDTRLLGGEKPIDIYWGWMEGRTDRVDTAYDSVIGGWSAATFLQVRDLFESNTGVTAEYLGLSPNGDRYFGRLTDQAEKSQANLIGELIFGNLAFPVPTYQVYFGGILWAGGGTTNRVGYLNLSAVTRLPREYTGFEILDGVVAPSSTVPLGSNGAMLVRNATISTVPIPAAAPLFASAMLVFGYAVRRRQGSVRNC